MNPLTDNTNQVAATKRLLALFSGLVVLACFYLVVSAYLTKNNTGLVTIAVSPSTAGITISQDNHTAHFLGIGKVRVRLAPGSYNLVAGQAGYSSASSVVQVNKKTVSSISLSVSKTTVNNASGLFAKLPFLGPASAYEITTGTEYTSKATTTYIEITSSGSQAQTAALDWIKSQGYNPTDYKIVYETSVSTDYHYIDGLPN